MTEPYINKYKWLKATNLITILFLFIFWIYFFVCQNNDPSLPPSYLSYERAFVIPDLLWICSLLVLSILFMARKNIKGIVTIIAAGSSLVFLALADISFNSLQGLYTKNIGEGILNIVINLLCLGYGMTLLKVGHELINTMTETYQKQCQQI